MENELYTSSEVICVKCGKRWFAVRPTTTLLKQLECPGCRSCGYAVETGEKLENIKVVEKYGEM